MGQRASTGTMKPKPPQPICIWVADNRPFVRRDAANRAAQRYAKKVGRPSFVCRLSISPVTAKATRIELHKVSPDGEITILPADTPLYAHQSSVTRH